MVRVAAKAAERTNTFANAMDVEAPALAPLDQAGAPAIDIVHLARMTGGDRNLEREVLELFAMQARMLLARMREQPPPAVGALAHVLNGSARGIGAWAVAEAAEALESSAAEAGEVGPSLLRLTTTVAAAQAAIGEMLQTAD